MVRLLSALSLLFAAAAMADSSNGHDVRLGAELAVSQTDAEVSWRDGGLGKLATTGNGLSAHRFYLDYSGRVSDTIAAHVIAEAFDDPRNSRLGLTEAYLQWRPVPVNALRTQLKLGIFYPDLSLENGGPGWSNEFLRSFSAINSWIAEELRSFGAELDVQRNLPVMGRRLRVGLTGSVFWKNDPAGGLLAWRGWSIHDRQSRWGEQLALADLPTLQEGGLFSGQAESLEPFEELDDEPGFTVGLKVQAGAGFLLKVARYDNRADPLVLEDGQYGWRTRFDHVGLRVRLPGEITLVSQWMQGNTQMGPEVDAVHAVDVDFSSSFVLLSRAWGGRRLSMRYDDFDTVDRDQTPMDTNAESGFGLTIGYRQRIGERIEVLGEWLSIDARRDSRMYFGEPLRARETRLSLTIRFTFDS